MFQDTVTCFQYWDKLLLRILRTGRKCQGMSCKQEDWMRDPVISGDWPCTAWKLLSACRTKSDRSGQKREGEVCSAGYWLWWGSLVVKVEHFSWRPLERKTSFASLILFQSSKSRDKQSNFEDSLRRLKLLIRF